MTSLSPFDPAALLDRVARDVVGMRREAEVLAVALSAGCHVVLEGPPGVGKSTLLRAMADESGVGMVFVEGNAELTPARLVGSHDPALVLVQGYHPDAFVAGPLVDAVGEGRLLYLEELNRIPEESLNVLITALAEGELHIPRVGRVRAHPSFRLIAAMNPYDAIGTARIGQAIYDRVCRIAVGYQDERHELEIVARAVERERSSPGRHGDADKMSADDAAVAVAVARATRSHPDVRSGSSVRGAIDMTLIAAGLGRLRGSVGPSSRGVLLDAACAALSGRMRVDELSERSPEDVIAELLDKVLQDRSRATENSDSRAGDVSADGGTNGSGRARDHAGKAGAPARG